MSPGMQDQLFWPKAKGLCDNLASPTGKYGKTVARTDSEEKVVQECGPGRG